MKKLSKHLELADVLSSEISKHHSVESIALGGSLISGLTDKKSDIDLYVYTLELIPLTFRQSIIKKFHTSRQNLNMSFWDLNDEWIHTATDIEVDVIFWDKLWIKEQIDKVIHQNQASLGYTTSFWHTILNSRCLYDRAHWFSDFQISCKIDYPIELQKTIIQKNFPVLKDVIPSYYEQIKKAIQRNDIISLNHRLTAFFASYFDVLFALNKIPNPGEKKVIPFILNNCNIFPERAIEQINQIFRFMTNEQIKILYNLDQLVEDLQDLLLKNNLI